MTQLTCENLTLGYGTKVILEHLSFSVNEGDYLCVVGENGTGKTTLMKTLLRLTKPLSGSVVFGEGLSRGQIGYLPQQTDFQRDFPASVREIVLSGFQAQCGLRPFYVKAEKRLAEKRMEEVGILSLARKCYRELSGGQQQRVLLARALCAARKMLLLDEPAAGLDEEAAERMYDAIERLKNSGTTIIMISHDIASTLKYATHILRVGIGTNGSSGALTGNERASSDERAVTADCGRSGVFFGTKEEYVRRFVSESEPRASSSVSVSCAVSESALEFSSLPQTELQSVFFGERK